MPLQLVTRTADSLKLLTLNRCAALVDSSTFENGGLQCKKRCKHVLIRIVYVSAMPFGGLLEVCVPALLRLSSIACIEAGTQKPSSGPNRIPKLGTHQCWKEHFKHFHETLIFPCFGAGRSRRPGWATVGHLNEALGRHAIAIAKSGQRVPEAVWAPEHGTSAPGETESDVGATEIVSQNEFMSHSEIHWVTNWLNSWNRISRISFDVAQPTACGANEFSWDGLGLASGWALQAQRFQLVPKPEPLADSCCVLPTGETQITSAAIRWKQALFICSCRTLSKVPERLVYMRQLMMLPFQDSGQIVRIYQIDPTITIVGGIATGDWRWLTVLTSEHVQPPRQANACTRYPRGLVGAKRSQWWAAASKLERRSGQGTSLAAPA